MNIQSVTGATGGTERAVPAVPVRPVIQDSVPQKHTALAQINTTKALKAAETKGETFSLGEEHLIAAIERANRALQGNYTSFEFSIHEGTKEIMVKVLNRDTGEVIREIPSEKVLDLVAKMWEMAGVFVDERR